DGSRVSASDAPTKRMPDFWQRNFFEHRLRPDERSDPFARYIFLNPYRTQLIMRQQAWPFWFRSAADDFDFLHLLEAGQYPPTEWIGSEIKDLGLAEETIGCD
ncbi:MAG: hypothetical protein NTY53_15485, partial [Kiritimatiellaeota bacterium]|nr:hypothetical protein [Kiritimatiellota bacterium]